MAIDLIKQQALDADRKAIQQITFAGILDQGEEVNYNTIMFFIIEEGKKNILDFSQGTVKILQMLSYSLARVAPVAKVSNRKVFDQTACLIVLFCLI